MAASLLLVVAVYGDRGVADIPPVPSVALQKLSTRPDHHEPLSGLLLCLSLLAGYF